MPLTTTYVAWNKSTNAPQTGDAPNHTLRLLGDGTEFAPHNAPAEVDATHLPGIYKLTLEDDEIVYADLTLGGVSSTTDVQIDSIHLYSTLALGGGGDAPDWYAAPPSTAAIAAAILASPANLLKTVSGGFVQLDTTQPVPTSNTPQTVGDALNAARAQAFGAWTLSGMTLTLYAADGATVVRQFTLNSSTSPTQRI
jgi:hypothetical protein